MGTERHHRAFVFSCVRLHTVHYGRVRSSATTVRFVSLRPAVRARRQRSIQSIHPVRDHLRHQPARTSSPRVDRTARIHRHDGVSPRRDRLASSAIDDDDARQRRHLKSPQRRVRRVHPSRPRLASLITHRGTQKTRSVRAETRVRIRRVAAHRRDVDPRRLGVRERAQRRRESPTRPAPVSNEHHQREIFRRRRRRSIRGDEG